MFLCSWGAWLRRLVKWVTRRCTREPTIRCVTATISLWRVFLRPSMENEIKHPIQEFSTVNIKKI